VIQGEFQDVRQVVAWIRDDLNRRYPNAEAEVFLETCADKSVHSLKGTLPALLSEVFSYCEDFPGAWVQYLPDHPYGRALKIVGHCGNRRPECEHQCQGYRSRRQAMVLITRAGEEEILVGRNHPPEPEFA
jgi:hypothetical protein